MEGQVAFLLLMLHPLCLWKDILHFLPLLQSHPPDYRRTSYSYCCNNLLVREGQVTFPHPLQNPLDYRRTSTDVGKDWHIKSDETFIWAKFGTIFLVTEQTQNKSNLLYITRTEGLSYLVRIYKNSGTITHSFVFRQNTGNRKLISLYLVFDWRIGFSLSCVGIHPSNRSRLQTFPVSYPTVSLHPPSPHTSLHWVLSGIQQQNYSYHLDMVTSRPGSS